MKQTRAGCRGPVVLPRQIHYNTAILRDKRELYSAYAVSLHSAFVRKCFHLPVGELADPKRQSFIRAVENT